MQPIIRWIFLSLCVIAALHTYSLAQDIVAADARIEALGRVAFTEGPVWHSDGSVFFSDIGNNRIMRLRPNGQLGVFRTPSGKANGLLFDLQGRLVACEGGNRVVSRTEPTGTIRVLANRYEGKRFNSPNDVTIDSKGNLFFTDPRYGDRGNVEMIDADGKAIEGVYRIDTRGTIKRIITHEVTRPNGIAVSPDDQRLFVADNANDENGNARFLWRFDLDENRDIVPGSQKRLFDWETDRGPDGMAIDLESRLYVTAGFNHANPPLESSIKHKAGVYVFSPDGELLETIPVPADMVTNCAFGGKDRKTLYITAGHKLWSIPVKHQGHTAWPSQNLSR